MGNQEVVSLYKTASEKNLEILEDEILSGKYKPGERLIEREIANRLGVSRVPIREALITLERWGFVKEKKANERWREVAILTKQDIHEVYHARLFIECQALSEKSLEEDSALHESLKQIVEKMDHYAEIKEVDTYKEMNDRFHHEFVLSLKNNRISRIYTDISRMLRWFQNITVYFPRMKQANIEHQRLLDAYQSKDLYEIRRLFQLHYQNAIELISKRVESR
jgi:DNA-binding GntR family transcriptional regulator